MGIKFSDLVVLVDSIIILEFMVNEFVKCRVSIEYWKKNVFLKKNF